MLSQLSLQDKDIVQFAALYNLIQPEEVNHKVHGLVQLVHLLQVYKITFFLMLQVHEDDCEDYACKD